MASSQKPETGSQQAMNTAVRMLTRRDHTRFEIQQKLRHRGFAPEAIRTVIAECERLNYLNDERTAQICIDQLLRRGFGFRRIAMELKKKGLREERFENILDKRRLDTDEREVAWSVLQKKMKRFEREEDHKKRRDKIYRFLDYRGFSKSVIGELLQELAP